LQHGIGQSSIGQGKPQQVWSATLQDSGAQQAWPLVLTNEKARPAESSMAAAIANDLFFMI